MNGIIRKSLKSMIQAFICYEIMKILYMKSLKETLLVAGLVGLLFAFRNTFT